MVVAEGGVSSSAILELIFEYYHPTGPRKQENYCKNFSPKTLSPSLQSLDLVLHFAPIGMGHIVSYVNLLGSLYSLYKITYLRIFV